MDDYSDDEFGDLNETALQELEQNAIQLTQARFGPSQFPLSQLPSRHPPPPPPPPPPVGHPQNYNDYGLDDDDLDDTVVFEVAGGQNTRTGASFTEKPHINSNLADHGEHHQQHHQWQHSSHQPQQYPVSRPIAHHAPTQRYVHPPPQYQSQQRYPPPPPPRPSQFSRPPPAASQFSRPPAPIPRQYPAQPSQAPNGVAGGNQSDIIVALQNRLSALESEVTASKGEAAILRSKYDKAQTEHEAAIARLKQQNAEHIAKQERTLEEARAAERTASTELQFAKQDLREELGRVKGRKKDGMTTPKKSSKTWGGVGDGFDTLEVTHSPGKGQSALRRQNSGPGPVTQSVLERTPTKGKRKRPPLDNPSFALETNEEELGLEQALRTQVAKEEVLVFAPPNALPYDFLKLVLDHHALHGQPPTFELFSRFAFKSDPTRTFASIIFQKLPQLGNSKEPQRLLVEFAEMIIDMWQKCLLEQYHTPIFHLAALVIYTLDINAVDVAPHVISSLVPICTTTCQLIALPRYRSADGDLTTNPDKVTRKLCSVIDVPQCLSLLHLAALGCMAYALPEPDEPVLGEQLSPQARFWRTIAPDFVLMMLSPKQPERDLLGILGLLHTSVLPGSIGPIPNAVSKASFGKGSSRSEAEELMILSADIVDKVSSFLGENPKWAERNARKQMEVRTVALRTLMMFASSPYGAQMIAQSDHVIPRLATVLCWAIDQLYDIDPGVPLTTVEEASSVSPGQPAESMEVDGQAAQQKNTEINTARHALGDNHGEGARKAGMLSRLIRHSTRLLHMLLTDQRTAAVIDMPAKLAASHGGAQRYLLTLARLNFAAEENSLLEAGILPETVDLAHDLLELVVNPEDAEEIQKAFGIRQE